MQNNKRIISAAKATNVMEKKLKQQNTAKAVKVMGNSKRNRSSKRTSKATE